MENLELRCLNKYDQKSHADFINELIEVDGSISPMAAGLRETDLSFDNWLERTQKNSKGQELLNGWVPSTIMFLFHKGETKILGAIDVRHKLNDFLLNHGGHIGYGIAPTERRKGYATAMLAMALDFCRSINLNKVMVSCNKNNIGSAKTIQKNGGILESEDIDEKGAAFQRYWIVL